MGIFYMFWLRALLEGSPGTLRGHNLEPCFYLQRMYTFKSLPAV
jgi:hypothetical protein